MVRLDFNADNQEWSVTDIYGNTHSLFTFIDDTHIALPMPDGSTSTFELSEAGLYAYQQVATKSAFALN